MVTTAHLLGSGQMVLQQLIALQVHSAQTSREHSNAYVSPGSLAMALFAKMKTNAVLLS